MSARRALAAVAAVLVLTGCGPQEPEGPTFDERCAEEGGTVMEDSSSGHPVSGPVTGVVVTGQGTAVGTGYGYGTATITIRLCVVGGDIVDMEVPDA